VALKCLIMEAILQFSLCTSETYYTLLLPIRSFIHFPVETVSLFSVVVDSAKHMYMPMLEVMFSTIYRPKLVSHVPRHCIVIGL
jgi:hypothetical protein